MKILEFFLDVVKKKKKNGLVGSWMAWSKNVGSFTIPPLSISHLQFHKGILVTLVWNIKGIRRFCNLLIAKQTIGSICLFSMIK